MSRVEEAHPLREVLPARAHQRRRHGRGLQGEGLRRRGLRAPASRSSASCRTSPRTKSSSRCSSTRRRSPCSCSTRTSRRSSTSARSTTAYFIALEYVHGKDLRAIFDRMPPARRADADRAWPASSMMQVCEGLDYAHNKRDAQGRELHLVHRDVSPQNVLIGVRGRGQAHRLRHRQGGRQGVEDPGRHPQGQVRLHVARAGARPADRSPQRHLRGRHRALRAAHRRAAVRRRERLLDAGEGAQRRDPAAVDVQPEDPATSSSASC